MEHARERWAQLTNEMLERRGRDERVDHRSYERHGIDLTPGEHYGPAAAHMSGRGADHDPLQEALDCAYCQEAIRAIDRQIAALEDGGRGGSRGAMEQGGNNGADRKRERDDRERPSR